MIVRAMPNGRATAAARPVRVKSKGRVLFEIGETKVR
jgi:hypothetical protein